MLLVTAAIILFGGLKRLLLQLGMRDFILMFFILLTVFGNLFNPVPLSPLFSVSLGSIVLIILSIVWLIRNIRITNRYLPLITIAVITIVSFVYQYILVNNTELNIYIAMLVAVLGISAVAVVMGMDGVEIITTAILGSMIGITLADSISSAQVVLGGSQMFSVMVISAFLSMSVYLLYGWLRRTTRKRYKVDYEAGESYEDKPNSKKKRKKRNKSIF